MGSNIIVGLPQTFNHAMTQCFYEVLQSAVGSYGGYIEIVQDEFLFRHGIRSGNYQICICVDDIGQDNEYAPIVIDERMGIHHTVIVVVPERCRGIGQLSTMISNGITQIAFKNEFTIETLRTLLEHPRSRQEAMAYCGIALQAIEVQPKLPKSMHEARERVKIIRLSAQEAKEYLEAKSGGTNPYEFLEFTDFDLGSQEMPYLEFPVDSKEVILYKERLRSYFRQSGLMTFMAFENGDLNDSEFRDILLQELQKDNIKESIHEQICDSFMRDVQSYGCLDKVIQTPDVTDIRLMNHSTINVQYKGIWYRTNITFESDQEYNHFIHKLCTLNQATINHRDPETIFTDITTFQNLTLRITVTHGLLSTDASYGSHIRISQKSKKTVKTLMKDEFMTKEQAALLLKAVQERKSICICGGSGSGKTILLNMLLEYLDPGICGTCIQESDELHSSNHYNIEFLHSITAKSEGGNAYTLKQLATKALLKNAEVFIIGEIKGEEAADFITASRTAACVYTTTHAEDCFGALPRIVELAKYCADYTQEELLRILSKNIKYVVYCKKYKCLQIARVLGYDENKKDVIYDLYEFESMDYC